jgi:hypothetical protein
VGTSDEDSDAQEYEEKKEAGKWQKNVTNTAMDDSDNEAYNESSGSDVELCKEGDDFSDDDIGEFGEDEDERERRFFGEDDPNATKSMVDVLSLTMQQRDAREKKDKVEELKADIN